MTEPIFSITGEIYAELTVADIWPDGDAPENPTPRDVAEVMRGCGSQWQVIRDWCLEPDGVYVESERVW